MLTICFIASSKKEVSLEFQFRNEKGSSKNFSYERFAYESVDDGCLKLYLKNRQKIKFLKLYVKGAKELTKSLERRV